MKRKTYKKAHKDCKDIISRHPQYDDFEIKYWGSRIFVRDPKGYSFGFIFSELPCFGFGFQASKDGTELKDGYGGYIVHLKPDDYKPTRRKPWVLGEWWWGPN